MAAPAIAAVAKKVIAAVITNPKARKKIFGIILCILLVILMPLGAVIAVFSGEVNIDSELLQEHIEHQLTEEEIAMLQSIEDTMLNIESKMKEHEYSDQQVKQAQVLYTLALYKFSNEENFVDSLVNCFATDQTDDELIAIINNTFSTSISVEEFTNAMESTQSDTESQQGDTI